MELEGLVEGLKRVPFVMYMAGSMAIVVWILIQIASHYMNKGPQEK